MLDGNLFPPITVSSQKAIGEFAWQVGSIATEGDGDAKGHAQACSQGGTCDGYNLFPQYKNFNNSAYKVFYENIIKKALDDPTKTVGPTTIKFNRSTADSIRPDTLSVTYTIDGRTRTSIFKNESSKP